MATARRQGSFERLMDDQIEELINSINNIDLSTQLSDPASGNITITPGGTNGNFLIPLPGNGQLTVSSSSSGVYPSIIAQKNVDSDNVVNVIDAQHLGVSNQPGAGFGAKVIFNLGGNTPTSPVNAGSIGIAWETAQINNTTARDTYLIARNMLNNTLQTALQISSGLDLSGPVSFTIGANTLDTNEWAALDGIHLGWTAWTPSWTNLTVGNGTNQGQYKQVGKTVKFRLFFQFGNASSIAGSVTLALPVAAAAYGGNTPIGFIDFIDDNTGAIYSGMLRSSGVLRVYKTDGTYLTHVVLSSTVPFTWATSDTIMIQGEYESA